MTQLMSGAINTSTFPTAPTCPTWLPFLLMSGPGAGGQDAWVCAESIARPHPSLPSPRGLCPPLAPALSSEFTCSKQLALTPPLQRIPPVARAPPRNNEPTPHPPGTPSPFPEQGLPAATQLSELKKEREAP